MGLSQFFIMTSETTFANAAFITQKKLLTTNKGLFYEQPKEAVIATDEEVKAILQLTDTNEPAYKKDPKSLATKLNVSSKILKRNRPIVVGHRGALYQKLENTRAFNTAAEIGCDYVELDVFLLKCNTLVVFHGGGTDANPGLLDDYCGVPGSILDYTAQEARTLLKFNPNYLEFGCGKQYMLSDEAHGEMFI